MAGSIESFTPYNASERARGTSLERGGHFAALEVPELLAEDIRAFFRPLRSWSS
jgi:hypothetical protein